MKKLLMVFTLAILHSSAFALVGFGVQAGTDLSKLGAYNYSEGLVSVNALEMDANPGNLGGYAFVDLFGYALEAEVDLGGGLYEFTFEMDLVALSICRLQVVLEGCADGQLSPESSIFSPLPLPLRIAVERLLVPFFPDILKSQLLLFR